MRNLITGATGFIGYHVTRLLKEQQCDIRALVCPASEVAELKKLGVELLTIGIRNEADLARACRNISSSA